MLIVIQCAGSKHGDKRGCGGGFLRSRDGRPVFFVARPDLAPSNTAFLYARPDDLNEDGTSWRRALLDYNNRPESNPHSLLPAYRLYKNRIYERLVDQLGADNVYILSAGWGLIPASFLLPYYDITFSNGAKEKYMRRRKGDPYDDFRLMPPDTKEPIRFFGGKDYVQLFCTLTSQIKSEKTVFYNSKVIPDAPDCKLQRFSATRNTNWQYDCANANAFPDGRIKP